MLEEVRPIVRHHHERPDGTGYPDRLKGDAIPLLARIISVVDVYDALTTERPYKPALPQEEAFRELRQEARNGWKFEAIVEEFIALACEEGFGGLAATDTWPPRRREARG